MKLREVLAGASLPPGGLAERAVTSLSYDTRTLTSGGLFFALPGYRTDGHRHIEEAVERGAAAVVCQRPPDRAGPWIVTEDPRGVLAIASANWFGRPGDALKLVAVTGTNGKTTTTYLLKTMLESRPGVRVGLVGTNQNMIGDTSLPATRTTPESYELQELLRKMVDSGCTHVVMEASSHALVQQRTGGLRFAAGIFTNLTRDHLDYHGSMEEYHRAKGLLFAQSEVAVLNLDDEAGRTYAKTVSCPIVTYSAHRREADVLARDVRLLPDRVRFVAVSGEKLTRVQMPIPGEFSVYNALGVLACGVALGWGLEESAAPLFTAAGVRGRVEVVPVPAEYTVLIDYAHTPDALENVLAAVRGFTKGRIIVVFGCGGDRDRSKRPMMGGIAARLADVVVVTSDNPRTEEPEAIIADILAGMKGAKPAVLPDRVEAIEQALKLARAGDTVVLAGKGHETYQEIQGRQRHLDEREVVRGFFRED